MSDVTEIGRRNFCLHACQAAAYQETFAALTSTCTHEACTITGFDSTNYVCPCHGSTFTTTGRVINGPANTPLRTFATQFSNNILTISI